MKVVHLTSAHSRYDTRIFLKMCSSLSSQGIDTTLVVADGNGDEKINGVSIVDIGRSSGGRLSRMTKTTRRIYKKVKDINADIVHFHDPELMPTCILIKLSGTAVIYDIHEDLPRDILQKNWIPLFLRHIVSMFALITEWLFSRLVSDVAITVTPYIATRFPKNTALLRNFPLLEEINVSDSTPYLDRPSAFVYTGGIDEKRGIKELMMSVELAQRSTGCYIELAGVFYPDSLQKEIRDMEGWLHVNYRGWVSRDKIVKMLSSARAGLVVLHPTPCFITSYPIKMFEYMAAGIPVIASNFPAWEEIIIRHRCGILVDPLDPALIAEAMVWILSNPHEAKKMGERGRSAVEEFYNWENEKNKLFDLYRSLEEKIAQKKGNF